MNFVTVKADIYSTTKGESYRLYIDNNLMTERTFVWDPHRIYIEECSIILADTGTTHTISVQSANQTDCFSIKNVTINGVNVDKTFKV